MKILMLAEGDPETRDSWSEVSRGLLLALRDLGHTVVGKDITESGLSKWLGMAATWSPSRRRWAARFHFGAQGFRARTARAARQRAGVVPPPDVVLQMGATFDATRIPGIPTFVYCDANVKFAMRGNLHADVNHLSPTELAQMIQREQSVYHGVSRVFTFSEYLRESFINDFAVPPERVETVYAGANLDLSRIRPREAVPAGPPSVLFVGRQWERKGGPAVVAAFREVRKAIPDARLRIVGCSPELGGEPGVEVIGRILKDDPGGEERLTDLYQTSDVFCMPSRFEPFGIVFVEAMMHGLPCIGTNRFAMPEIISDGETGWLVPEDDIRALGNRLITALSNRPASMAMGHQGLIRARDLFTWKAVAGRMAHAMQAGAGPR